MHELKCEDLPDIAVCDTFPGKRKIPVKGIVGVNTEKAAQGQLNEEDQYTYRQNSNGHRIPPVGKIPVT